ncbi:hypothetical protein GF322_03360 [Candidatus Dependentiae bacterium]|nr:hypothetical protein [Candidatus Dependentiae bacterium]
MLNENSSMQTHLFVGPSDFIFEKAELLLQKNFCINKKENEVSLKCFCNQCRKIKSQQHEFIVFINPKKDYTVKDIEVIFEKINFKLDADQKFFFILQDVQNLNLACANRLLKVLEEPAKGYNFILLSDNINSVLPTIISRCCVTNFLVNQNTFESLNTLLLFFYEKNLDSPLQFDKELKNSNLTDSQSIKILHEMMAFYSKKIIEFSKKIKLDDEEENQKRYLEKVYNFLKERVKKPPQSGSSNIFWKNLYISFPKD